MARHCLLLLTVCGLKESRGEIDAAHKLYRQAVDVCSAPPLQHSRRLVFRAKSSIGTLLLSEVTFGSRFGQFLAAAGKQQCSDARSLCQVPTLPTQDSRQGYAIVEAGGR